MIKIPGHSSTQLTAEHPIRRWGVRLTHLAHQWPRGPGWFGFPGFYRGEHQFNTWMDGQQIHGEWARGGVGFHQEPRSTGDRLRRADGSQAINGHRGKIDQAVAALIEGSVDDLDALLTKVVGRHGNPTFIDTA
jgi:hypothetical protein